MGSKRKFRRHKVKLSQVGDAAAQGVAGIQHTFRRTDLVSAAISSDNETLSVEVLVPLDNGEIYASYEHEFDLEDPETPAEIRLATQQLAEATVRALNRRHMRGEYPCATCTSKCCGREFAQVRVTQKCIDTMRGAGLDVETTIDTYDMETWDGYVGQFAQVPYKGPGAEEGETCCPFLAADGCSIYDVRPLVCKEYSAWTCDIYEPDPAKLDGKVHLRVV